MIIRALIFILLLASIVLGLTLADSSSRVKNGIQDVIKITVLPKRPYVEQSKYCQYLNFDFIVENETDRKLTLTRIDVSVFDKAGILVLKKFIGEQGLSPSINAIPSRELASKGYLQVFNPFYVFDRNINIRTMRYEFIFDSPSLQYQSEVMVSPLFYRTRTDLILPLKGRMLVFDGHDFYAHHRRLDFTTPLVRQILRIESVLQASNPQLYAIDLCLMNHEGQLFRGDGRKREDWFGWSAPIYAPAQGKVVEARNDIPDNLMGTDDFDFGAAIKNYRALSGNYLIIDHGDGEYSLLAHMKQKSLRVKAGDEVRQGQMIGRIGFSGSTAEDVDLHYHLSNNLDQLRAQGVPAYFRAFTRVGSGRRAGRRGQLDTGDIVESN